MCYPKDSDGKQKWEKYKPHKAWMKKKKKTFEIYTYNIQTCSVKKKDSLHSEQNENVRKKRTRIDEKKVFSIRKCLWKALHTEEEKINKTEKYFREKNIYTCIYCLKLHDS